MTGREKNDVDPLKKARGALIRRRRGAKERGDGGARQVGKKGRKKRERPESGSHPVWSGVKERETREGGRGKEPRKQEL